MTRRILLAGGASGGHLYPALALARALAEGAGIESHVLAGNREAERRILESAPISVERVAAHGGRGPLAFARYARALGRIFARLEPAAFVGLGGMPSVLPGLIARWHGVPVFLLEQNRIVGRANRALMPCAKRIFLCFRDARGPRGLRRRGIAIGCPVRSGFSPAPLPGGVPAVLVLGGSQGAEDVNRLLESALPALAELRGRVRFIHVTGPGKDRQLEARYRDAGFAAEVRDFAADPAPYFAAASLIVARAGGSTIAEILAVGRGSLLLPYPHHSDRHQFLNAEPLCNAGAARLLSGDVAEFATTLRALIQDGSALAAMAASAGDLAAPAAAARIADVIATHLGCAPSGADPRAAVWAGAA
ncbi:MAG: UDP-N-acetylglucosamine--N-acetylmuramyl-(pentapeptide) pyrophosphoryl-undecaprenol N-acetylglucosamine transferase [Planctomycetes bacterium]|nr:UDP-N-acetylglucosamine--N-acetylmuramyl-(pentapeptide) pyrophosphoryl-undecaprenol N-acetylglucosamine transferase [Planctomycetota bacterium]